ncbi:MAG: iron-containing redox enzyme family protein [Pseudobdellovibrionaceae bacterium]
MSIYEKAASFWNEQTNFQNKRQWAQKLAAGELGLPHYVGFLIETYHNAGLNPQLQGFATMYFSEKKREIIKKFFQHAISEIGHDLLALQDLSVLGVSKELVMQSKPLPLTKSFFANTLAQTQKYGAPAYLAYLFHLEFSPVTSGPQIMQMLKTKGIPEEAMTFLHEHATVDVNHLKMMRSYLDSLITDECSEEIFFSSLYEVIVLHNRMLEGAFENGERFMESKINNSFASVS